VLERAKGPNQETCKKSESYFHLRTLKEPTSVNKHPGAPSHAGNFSNACARQASLNTEHQAYRKLRAGDVFFGMASQQKQNMYSM
jgi:hypothetical protein